MAYAPDGEQPAVGYYGGHVQLLEAASLSLVSEVQHSRGIARRMAYAPNCDEPAA